MPGILSGAAVASRLAAPISPALWTRLTVSRLQALSRTRTTGCPPGQTHLKNLYLLAR